MKKALLLATTGLALLLAGCSNSSTSSSSSNNDSKYQTEMTKGNDAVSDGNYSKAADYFDSANKAKKSTKAKASKVQAENLANVKKYMNKRQFSDAKDALETVKNQDNGSKKMVAKAKSLLSDIKTIQRKRSDFKEGIKTAKTLIKQGSNSQARSLLEQITKDKAAKGKYYSDLYTQAKTLLDSLPTTDTNTTTNTTDNTNNSSNNSTTTDNNSASSSDNSDNQSGNPAANGDFDVEKKEVNGKEITADDIAKGRQQLTDSGVKNVGAWSDNDIVKAIKNAAKEGRTTIKASDIKGGN